jgi:crotonobetainyl-CoA:carnitine CoA-transferase CaiB-like acyl-CoA transferase
MAMAANDGVLGGIKVIDLSEQVPGPYATRLLAGLGADVIKVERPDSGDRLRHRPAMFNAENRGKRLRHRAPGEPADHLPVDLRLRRHRPLP